MAGAIIPLVTAAIGAIGPQIPSIVQWVEDLFGHSSKTGNQDGTKKMETAVQMLTTALQQLANAGKIPSAPVVDPSLPAALVGAIQQAVNAMKASGALGDPAQTTPPALTMSPSPAIVSNNTAVSSPVWKFTGVISQ